MRASVFVIIGLILLSGLFLLLRPLQPPPPTAHPIAAVLPLVGSAQQEAPSVSPEDEDEWPVVRLRVADGALQEGPSLIRVQQGDPVHIVVQSDRDDEFHLHGYDRVLPLSAGEPGELRFTAEYSGRFTFELHALHLELGALEVLPR